MEPIKHVTGKIEAGNDFNWGFGVFDAVREATTKKAEILLEEAMGLHCGDGPFCDVVMVGDKVCLKFSVWLCPMSEPDDKPFIFIYPLENLLKNTFKYRHDGLATCDALQSLINDYNPTKD